MYYVLRRSWLHQSTARLPSEIMSRVFYGTFFTRRIPLSTCQLISIPVRHEIIFHHFTSRSNHMDLTAHKEYSCLCILFSHTVQDKFKAAPWWLVFLEHSFRSCFWLRLVFYFCPDDFNQGSTSTLHATKGVWISRCWMRSEVILYRSKNHISLIDDASFVMLNDFTLSSVFVYILLCMSNFQHINLDERESNFKTQDIKNTIFCIGSAGHESFAFFFVFTLMFVQGKHISKVCLQENSTR